MAQMPDIKPEVNKEPERDKKRGGGFLARLFGGGSGGGSMAAGGFGAGAGGGGLLATKAGLLAMIVAGTTVAGGIGMVGYRMFGPGSEQNEGGMTLFAVKPKEAAPSSDAQNAAPKDGSSASLDYLAKANSAPKEPEVKPAEAPKDAGAASAAPAADAAAGNAGANGPINAAGSAGNGVSKGMLKTGGKFGELSKNFGGGGGGAVAGGPAKPGSGPGSADAFAAANKNGQATGMRKGVAAMGGGSRAVASRKGANTGMRQALGALADNRGATTSYGAGRTYDGSAAQNTGNIGPTGGEIGMGGQGDTTGTQPTSTPNTANQSKEFKAPPTPDAVMMAPWQKAIDTAKMMVALAGLLMLLAYALKGQKWFHYIKMYLAGIVIALGIAVMALGGKIAGGEYGQKDQGMVLGAAGLGLTIMGAAMMMDGEKKASFDGENVGSTTNGVTTYAENGGEGVKASGGIMGMNPLVVVGGGMAVLGMIGSMMMPPKKYPSTQFENGHPPDANWFGYAAPPSETAVRKMTA